MFAAATAAPAHAPDPSAFPHLTEREREVLDLLAQGLTNSAVAQRLFASEKTVRNHVQNIFAKINARDRADAIAITGVRAEVLAHRTGQLLPLHGALNGSTQHLVLSA